MIFNFSNTNDAAAFQLLSDVTVTGGGTLDFRPFNSNTNLDTLGGDFAFINEDNRIRGYGFFRPAWFELGPDAVLKPNFTGSGAAKPTVVIEAPTRFNGSEIRIDLRGTRIAEAAPDPAAVNTRLSGGVNDLDQIHVFDTLTLDGIVNILISLEDGFTPETGDFFGILTADEILLNGSLSFDFPVVNELTFEYEILKLFDPSMGFNRDVLRITFGAQAVPEPGCLGLLLSAVLGAGCLGSRRRERI